MYLPYSGNFLKVQNFSVKLKHFPEEILEEFNSKSSYIIPHKVTCKLICHLSLIFEDLMVAIRMFENFKSRKENSLLYSYKY